MSPIATVTADRLAQIMEQHEQELADRAVFMNNDRVAAARDLGRRLAMRRERKGEIGEYLRINHPRWSNENKAAFRNVAEAAYDALQPERRGRLTELYNRIRRRGWGQN